MCQSLEDRTEFDLTPDTCAGSVGGSVPQWEIRKMGVKTTTCPPGWSCSALPRRFSFFMGLGWDRKKEREGVRGKEEKERNLRIIVITNRRCFLCARH